METNILIVDDEAAIADLVEVYLKNEGYTVHKFGRAGDALACVASTPLDLAILDVMLPDMDGFTLCQKIREEHLFPILMLTARVEDMDKIMGLTLGADDYLTKPFNPLELEKYMDSNNTVMSHIARLREKMHEPSRKPKFIKTVWGVGYTIE